MNKSQFDIVKFFQKIQPDYKKLAKAFKEEKQKIEIAYKSPNYEDFVMVTTISPL